MKLPLLCALMLFAAGNLYGQLGQTEQATTTAFGKPFGSPHNAGDVKIVTFRTTAYEITVGFKGGTTIYLIYKKIGGADWAPADVMAVLNANSPGQGYWAKMAGKTHTQFHVYGALAPSTKLDGVQAWQFYSHKNLMGELHPESKAVVVWDSASGLDSGAILGQNTL